MAGPALVGGVMFHHVLVLLSYVLVVVVPVGVFCAGPSTSVMDRLLYLGSSPLATHLPNITSFFYSICSNSDVHNDNQFDRCAYNDTSLVAPDIMIGNNMLINMTSNGANITSIKTWIDQATPDEGEDLEWIDDLISLHTTRWDIKNQTNIIYYNQTVPKNVTVNGTDEPTVQNVTEGFNRTTWYMNATTITLSFNPSSKTTNISNIKLASALAEDKGLRKKPEWLIIQDQPYLPLYSPYRNMSLVPALHEILTYGLDVRSVLLLPTWADLDPSNLVTQGLNYTDRQHMQSAIDDAYHNIETELHTWINSRTYPVTVTVSNRTASQQRPTLATIPVGPVFEDIIRDTSEWSVLTYDFVYLNNQTFKEVGGADGVYNNTKIPSITNVIEKSVNGTSLLYSSPPHNLSAVGEYVISLLIFSSMYNYSVNGSMIPPLNKQYPVINETSNTQLAEFTVTLSIPYITNATATRIQHIVDAQVTKKLGINLTTYYIPTTQPPTTLAPTTLAPTTVAPITAAPNTTVPPTGAPTTSTPTPVGSTDHNQSSSDDRGIKSYWAAIVGGIVAVSICLYCCYRKKQTTDRKAGYGRMEFDMDAGYEVELADD